MSSRKFIVFSISLFLSFFLFQCKKDEPKGSSTAADNKETLDQKKGISKFEKVDSSVSKVDFNNKITHDVSTKFNLFDYDYFYNGSGVGAEDLNNDGLIDLVFCGNQVENKIYLNKGNLVFEDITENSGINTNKYWSSGITFADINTDGWMDFYISQGGPHQKENRANLLYINQGDLTFVESAQEFGLADSGISTQSAFFDFDNDGDLDCIVMNENDYYGQDPESFYRILSNKSILKENSSHLYENRNGKFVDITEKAGLLKPSFGLGLCVSDINEDGWLDIYIANDYYVPDALYINNGNGTFSDKIKEHTQQVSFYGMGMDIADLNNDSLKDIVVLDMASSDHIRAKTLMASMDVPRFKMLTDDLGLQYQYMFNSVQLNMGNQKFHNVAQLTGMAKTDWSWAALIFDANHDGKNDVYVSNGYRRYALDNDSRMAVSRAQQQFRGNVPLNVKEEIYNSLPSEKLPNILYQNKGDLKFEDVTSFSALNEPSFSNGAIYADLDNDGDQDLIVNNMDQEAFIFKNTASETEQGHYLKVKTEGILSEDFAKVRIYYNGSSATKESKRVRGYISSVDKTIHFGLGDTKKVDSVLVKWLSGKQQLVKDIDADQTITLREEDALNSTDENKELESLFIKEELVDLVHVENPFNDFQKEVLLPYKQSTQGPYLSSADLNNDGNLDIVVGGASGYATQIYFGNSSGFTKSNTQNFEKDKLAEDMEILAYDHDNDGDLDLYIVSGGSEFNERDKALADRLYINDGSGNFSKMNNSELDLYTISGKTIAPIDFDKDGDTDLILGNRIKPQKYPLHEPSIIYRNDNGLLTNVTGEVAVDFEDFGMVNKVVVSDFNQDGWDDFLAVGEWTHLGLFLNENGTFRDISSEYGLQEQKGWWFSAIETDLNKDGFPDFVIGNIGNNIKFKVSKNKPLRVYADDFDDNGTHDVVLSYKYNDIFVPVRGKECSTQQMPFIAEKMPTFNEFANASLQDIYGSKISTAYSREVNQFKSVILLNDGKGGFYLKELDVLAQSIPITDLAVKDLNSDGIDDIVAVGNIYNTEVETPRLDNPFALVLISNGNDNYNIIPPQESGLYIDGDARSVEFIEKNGKTHLLIATNNGPLQTFQLQVSK